ncbi:MAG: 30S ribosomal protein S16 [Phycisphaerales bacterium]|nr:30S ribosomal protein S16 [Phycisphaerales bacterium]
MVRLRMQRFGRTHRPFYRINAIDQRTRRNGRVLENLGHYDPMCKDEDKQIVLKIEEIKVWLAKGAQPSDTVRDMLGKADILEGDMKAKWISDRATNMKRGECKKARKEIEGIVASLEKMAGDSDADLTPFVNSAKKAFNMVQNTLSLAKDDEAAKCLAAAKDAMSKAESAKPAPAPEPVAEEAAE